MDRPGVFTWHDVVSYMESVEKAFLAEPEKYQEFLDIFKDGFRVHIINDTSVKVIKRMMWIITSPLRRLDVDNSITKVEGLMEDNQNLLIGLIVFLPEAQRTISPEADQRAANFLAKLKDNDLDVFESFCEILKWFKEGKKSVKEVYEEVVELVQGHDDLVMELSEFFSGRPLEIAKYIRRLSQL